jgi:hypothetical protein
MKNNKLYKVKIAKINSYDGSLIKGKILKTYVTVEVQPTKDKK